MKTDDFELGAQVKINSPKHFMHNMVGTVTGRDYYTVEVRFDIITAEMLDYEDTRKGLASFEPNELILLS